MCATYAASHNGNLDPVNAVLGCAIIMPKCLSNEDVDIFDDFDEARARKILDILIYTDNWLRESIGGFASQNDIRINKKVGSDRLSAVHTTFLILCVLSVNVQTYTIE